jgi:hypothetical protein
MWYQFIGGHGALLYFECLLNGRLREMGVQLFMSKLHITVVSQASGKREKDERQIVVRQFKTLFSMRRTWYSQDYAYNPQMTIAGVVLRK